MQYTDYEPSSQGNYHINTTKSFAVVYQILSRKYLLLQQDVVMNDLISTNYIVINHQYSYGLSQRGRLSHRAHASRVTTGQYYVLPNG